MLCFDGENKSGFAKGTRSVTLRYIRSTFTKIYRIEPELFGWFYSVKKSDVFLIAKFATPWESYGPVSGITGRLCTLANASDPP